MSIASLPTAAPAPLRLGERAGLVRLLPWLFGATLFLSAALLFLVQPMFARMVLPSLGGTPAVWNTCVVFFQAALLAGYGYAHTVSTYLKTRTQLLVHGALFCVPLV